MSRQQEHCYFRVVVNSTGDSGIWPVGRQAPSGWQATAFAGRADACGHHVAAFASAVQPAGRAGETLSSALATVVARHPTAPAVRDGAMRLTYRDLHRRVRARAEQLARSGVTSGDRLAILAGRGPGLVVTALAVLEVGAACVLVDEGEALKRRRDLIGHVQPRLVITADLGDEVGPDGSGGSGDSRPDAAGAGAVAYPWSAAFLIYDRGGDDTCGVVWQHRQLVRLAGDCGLPPAGPGVQVTQRAPVWHAMFPVEVLRALLTGAELVIPATGGPTQRSAASTVTLSGVTDPSSGLVRVRTRGRGWVRELIGFGETTMACAQVGADGGLEPVSGARLYVLDHDLHLVPEGGIGRLFIGGDVVAGGYVGRPRATLHRFLPDPLAGSGGRMFRTGILARRVADDRVEFCSVPRR